MTRYEMNHQVSDELRPYPRSGNASPQNIFRSVYWMARMNSMGRKAELPNSATVVRQYALEIVRKDFPGFELIES
jgi:hypothetical protein